MRLTVTKALDYANSADPIERLYHRAWAGQVIDPELSGLIAEALGQLEEARAEVARLKLEAADRAETRASQEELGLRERPHLIVRGSTSVVITPDRECEWLRRAVGEK